MYAICYWIVAFEINYDEKCVCQVRHSHRLTKLYSRVLFSLNDIMKWLRSRNLIANKSQAFYVANFESNNRPKIKLQRFRNRVDIIISMCVFRLYYDWKHRKYNLRVFTFYGHYFMSCIYYLLLQIFQYLYSNTLSLFQLLIMIVHSVTPKQ